MDMPEWLVGRKVARWVATGDFHILRHGEVSRASDRDGGKVDLWWDKLTEGTQRDVINASLIIPGSEFVRISDSVGVFTNGEILVDEKTGVSPWR